MTESSADKTGKVTAVLPAFSRQLDREVLGLSREPQLLWQQMYYGLQAESVTEQHLDVQRHKRTNNSYSPWMRLRYAIHTFQALQDGQYHPGSTCKRILIDQGFRL